MIKIISGVSVDSIETKNVGDKIVVDGETYVIESSNVNYDEFDGVYRFHYDVKKYELTEEERIASIRDAAGLE